MLRQEPANQLCVEFAKRRWIYDKESKTYDAMPAQTMGIAHNFTPGVHQNLEYYQKATEKLRSKLGREGCDTQDSVMVLPCSVFSQGLPPDIEATADHSTRLCVRDKEQLSTIAGKAYLPDATEFDKALLKEPLWRRPCQASIQDNPFATSYEHGSSFFGAASGLGMLALVVGGVERLGKIMWMWHNEMSDADATPATMLYAVSGLMMLSTMYPVTWNIGEEVIPPSYAEMMPAVFRKYAQEGCRKPSQMCMPGLGFSEEMMQDARSFCDAMFKDTLGMKASRLTTWDTAVAPLLEEIVKWKGSHDMSVEQHKRMSEVLDNAARAAWIQHSPDGVTPPAAPCPAGEVSEWTRVRRPQLDPVFVGDEKTGASARGCLVGLKPHQLRQICALAVGAHLPNVKCQVVRNEGAQNATRTINNSNSLTILLGIGRRIAVRPRFGRWALASHQLGGGHARREGQAALVEEHLAGADGGRVRRVRLAQGQGERRATSAQRVGQKRAAARAPVRGNRKAAASVHSRPRGDGKAQRRAGDCKPADGGVHASEAQLRRAVQIPRCLPDGLEPGDRRVAAAIGAPKLGR